jgi:hypothetical protein
MSVFKQLFTFLKRTVPLLFLTRHLAQSQLVECHFAQPVMILSVEGTGGKLGDGIGAADFQSNVI